MPLGITFTIRGDSTSAINAVKGVQQSIGQLNASINNELADKLKTLFSVGFLEEAARRTGQWALALETAAKDIGVSAETYQGFKILAQNAEVAEDKVLSFYQSVDAARKKAIQGDSQSMFALNALGISAGDVYSNQSSAAVFNKVIQKQSLGNVLPGSLMSNAVTQIFGENSLPALRNVVKEAGGKSVEQYGADSGMVASDSDVAQIAEMWKQTLNDLKQALIAMIPLGKLLLGVVDVVAKAIAGVGDLIGNLIKGKWSNAFGIVASAGVSLVTDVLKLFDLVTGLISKVPGLHKLKSNFAGSYSEAMARDLGTLGVSQKLQGEGGAIGQVVEAGLTGGAAEAGTKAALAKVTDKLLTDAVTLEGNGLAKSAGTVLKGAGIIDKVAPIVAKVIGTGVTGALIGRMSQAGAANASGANAATNLPFNAQRIQQAPFSFTGENNANLRIGGIFSSGVQVRMVRLTERMVSILTEIQRNTQYNNPYTIAGHIQNSVTTNAYAPSGLR